MKQNKTNPLLQLSLIQKITIGFTIPLATVLVIGMFAIIGLKNIQTQTHDVYQKIAQTEETKLQAETLEMVKELVIRINFIQKQLIMFSLISVPMCQDSCRMK